MLLPTNYNTWLINRTIHHHSILIIIDVTVIIVTAWIFPGISCTMRSMVIIIVICKISITTIIRDMLIRSLKDSF